MKLFTVYCKPRDYPDSYVVREFEVSAAGASAAPAPLIVADTYPEAIRAIPRGLFCVPRHPDDDANILEVWL